jgi:hypothetical protein
MKTPKHKDASRQRVSDLKFEAGQRKMWATRFSKNPAEAEAHMRKYRAAVKALKTLGYDYNDNL